MEAMFLHLIVDTNAIIAGAPLHGLAQQYWTVAEVLSEVKDERARATLNMLPFKLETRIPAESSVEAVKEFARKTGDIRSFSKADLHLLALAHQLEKEANGTSHIRDEPPKLASKLGKPSNSFAGPKQVAECRFFHTVGGCRNGDACTFRHEGAPGPLPQTATTPSSTSATGGPVTGPRVPAADATTASADTAAPEKSNNVDNATEDDDGEGEWIGPSGPEVGPLIEASDSDMVGASRKMVACITTDFAMQNVLLQMGLLLATHSGKIVTSVKQWVLKCDACFSIFPMDAVATHVEHSMFCKRCGNATLARLGVTLGADGTPRYHYKKHRQINTRGTIYALPNPKGGRAKEHEGKGHGAWKGKGGELLLRPDQLLTGGWKERVRQANQDNRESLLDERTVDDVLGRATGSSGGSGSGGGWVGPGAGSGGRPAAAADGSGWLEVGFGRRNPNSVRTHHRGHKK